VELGDSLWHSPSANDNAYNDHLHRQVESRLRYGRKFAMLRFDVEVQQSALKEALKMQLLSGVEQ
jgi:hypothetical protein